MSLTSSLASTLRLNPFTVLDQQHAGFVPPRLSGAILDFAQRTGNQELMAAQLNTLRLSRAFSGDRVMSPSFVPPHLVVDELAYEKGRDAKTPEGFIYTANGSENLPGKTLWREWEDVNAAAKKDKSIPFVATILREHAALQARHGISWAREGDLHNTIHYGRNYNNAFFDGRQMVDGDGDGKFLKDLHLDGTVTHHEVGHGDTQFEAGAAMKAELLAQKAQGAQGISIERVKDKKTGVEIERVVAAGKSYGGLDYEYDPGALNESYSDIEAKIVDWRGKKYAELTYEDKLLGKDAFVAPNNVEGSKIKGKKSALRNFDNLPGYENRDVGKDEQPKHVKDKYRGDDDNGGVHENSGIFNHAFLLSWKHLAEVNASESIDALEMVWFKARKVMHTQETFDEAVQHILDAAKELYPSRPEVAKAVEQAFVDVGLVTPKGIVGTLTQAWYWLRSTTIWLPERFRGAVSRSLNQEEIESEWASQAGLTLSAGLYAVARKDGAGDSDAGRGDEGKA